MSAGEQSVVADAGEARRQDVQREPPDKFVGVQRHHFGLGAVFIVFPGEGDFAVGKIEDAVVADGNAVGVSPEVVDDLLRSAERGFGVDHPVVLAQCLAQRGEVRARRCLQLACGMRVLQALEVVSAEDLGQRFDRE